ncbi:restriction endonuclease subunit S [Dorea sp. YH-dor226]|uniref:restriction endonuclease subunit S n=1 Tax=Dorea sp. YH-dor226 TaxID=3151119 RepID=UPI00324227FF
MEENRKKPQIRFAGYTDDWEQRKLGEVGSVSMCRRIFKEQTSESGDIPFYKIGTFGGQADAYISSELFAEYRSKYPYPKEGDILISASGSIGRTVEFTGKNEYFQDSNIVWLSHDDRLDNSFLKCFYSVVKWAGIEGSTIKRLYNDNILNTVISMPSVDEQRRIGTFFKELDNLITLHQRKYNKLVDVKKSMLEKMFPKNGEKKPEIRFGGFTDDWEQRKLGEVATYRRGSFPQPYGKSEWYDGDGAMPFVQVADVSDEMNLVEDTKQKISILAQPMSVFVEKNSVLVTLQGSIGRVAITQYGAFVDRTVLIFEKYKVEIDKTFWAYIIKQKFIDEARKAPGGTIKTITKEALSDFDLSIPNYQEQKQIGEYFRHLDNLITLHQREVEKLKNIKKSMLAKMFL